MSPSRSQPGRDERLLAKRLKRRDPDALRDVYERFGRASFGYLLQILPDRATAEDVQQQVFLQVWQRAHTYDPDRGSLLTWILTIARSRAIDELRRRVPEPRDPSGAIALLESAQGSDSRQVDELLEHWLFAQLLDRLPAGEADVLRRRFYLRQTQAQIAAETGIALGTIKARMVSGLDGLRTLIDSEPR
jgi:RNA polymerase sigma-70 factor (ECF subfamily)